MPMIKDGIKMHRCNVWRLDNAATHAMRYIKVWSVLTDMTDTLKKWKRCPFSTQNDHEKKKVNQFCSFCYIARTRILFWTDEQMMSNAIVAEATNKINPFFFEISQQIHKMYENRGIITYI